MVMILKILKIILLIFSLFLFSCSANYHAKKAIKKGLPIIKSDTLISYDTVFIENKEKTFIVKFDTIEKFFIDTVIIWNDKTGQGKLTIIHDTIKIDCPDCPQVTKTKTVQTDRLVIKQKSLLSKIIIWITGNFLFLTSGIIIISVILFYKKIKSFF